MLNGKFYTGLPPKMINRDNAGSRNRLESHLFWPDDTKTETAAENRIKRRNSMQLASVERPLYEKQNSMAADGVDTKKRFSKEFSQSSIQFYDNLNEHNGHSRRNMLRNSSANRKMDVTEKPTKTKLEVPDNVINEAYTAAKKKQTLTSKIGFYDYENDSEDHNKIQKLKVDVNDIREMELNSKNSPKLREVREVRSLSEERNQHKKNNHGLEMMEHQMPNKKSYINERREHYLRGRESVEPRLNVSPKRNWAKSYNNYYSCERDICREPEPPSSYIRNYANSERIFRRGSDEQRTISESGRYSPGDYESFKNNSFHWQKGEESKRDTKHNNRAYEAPDERYYCQRSYEDDELSNRIRNISLKSTKQPQQQYCSAEECYDDSLYCDQNAGAATPTNRGSFSTLYDHNERIDNEADCPYTNYNNNPRRTLNNKPSVNKIHNKLQRDTVASSTSPSPSDAESSVSATKSQRHLRSSFCFSVGEIIGENDASTSPTTSHSQRRSARNSATQHVSVGLPD